MTTDDYSFCQEENTTLSGESSPQSTNDHSNTTGIPSAILDPMERENALLRNKLDKLLSFLSGNQEGSEGSTRAPCIVELFQQNQRLNAQVMNCLEEIKRLRPECDAWKAAAELKDTAEKLTTEANRIESVAAGTEESFATSLATLQENLAFDTKKEFEQLIVKLNEKHDDLKSSVMAELEEHIRVELARNQASGLQQQQIHGSNESSTNNATVEPTIHANPSQPPIYWKHSQTNLVRSSSCRVTDVLNCPPLLFESGTNGAPVSNEIKSLMAAVQKNASVDNNVGFDDESNQDASSSPDIYTTPSHFPILWKASKSTFATQRDILECPPLRFGKRYKWSVKVESTGGDMAMGVVSTLHFCDFNKPLRSQQSGWVYGSRGCALHADNAVQYNLPNFDNGSKLTFILDLTRDGTLCVYHDDDESNLVELFVNMKSGSDDISTFAPVPGFVPAVSLVTGRVEFLGFEDH